MSFKTQQTALENYFQTQWTYTEIDHENEHFVPANVDEFVRFSVQFGEGLPMALGNKHFRYFGVVFVQIFVKPGVGNARSMELVDYVSAIFRTTLAVAGVHFKVPVPTKFPNPDGGWVQTQVHCDFYFEEHLA